jgi:hypothetical protein
MYGSLLLLLFLSLSPPSALWPWRSRRVDRLAVKLKRQGRSGL